MRAVVTHLSASVAVFIFLAVAGVGLARGQTNDRVSTAQVSFNPENGGRWALNVTGEIARVGRTDSWECRLTLKNIGAAPIVVTRADAFVGGLKGNWRGLAFHSKWGEEWEPEEFVVSGHHEFDVRSGRSSMGRNGPVEKLP